jgi:Predicted membrane protein
MIYCTKCGTQVPDGMKFCTVCGTPVEITTTVSPPPPSPPKQTVQQPVYQQPAPQTAVTPVQGNLIYKEEPISTGAYVGIMFLLLIPILNLLLLIIWACGGCNKRNKRNLSRAILIWMVIGAALSGLIYLAGMFLFGDQINAIRDFWGTQFINQ